MEKEKRLSELCVGETATVAALCTSDSMRRRFLDIGLIEGTQVSCVGKSPFGDPRAYLIRGKVIAFRSRDAESIIIFN